MGGDMDMGGMGGMGGIGGAMPNMSQYANKLRPIIAQGPRRRVSLRDGRDEADQEGAQDAHAVQHLYAELESFDAEAFKGGR